MSHDKAGRRGLKMSPRYTSNARANQAAYAQMSRIERETGLTELELIALHAEQKARVLKRWGKA